MSRTVIYRRNVLTLDLPHAREPILWRQAMKNMDGMTVTVQAMPEGGYGLAMRIGDTAEQVVAVFDDVKDAHGVRDELRKIMLKSDRRARGPIGLLWSWIKWPLIIIFLLFATYIGLRTQAQMAAQTAVSQALSETQITQQAAPEVPGGVPILADDYLTIPGASNGN